MSLSIKQKWDNLIKRDPVKAAIAGAVQRNLRSPFAPAIPAASELGDEDIEVQAIDPLESIVRVNTDKSKRHFRVRVSEIR